MRCRYNVVSFLPNPHNRHPIARPWGTGCLLWVCLKSDWRSAAVIVVSTVMSWYIGPRYNGTRLYLLIAACWRICASGSLVIIVSDRRLVPIRCQTTTWTSDDYRDSSDVSQRNFIPNSNIYVPKKHLNIRLQYLDQALHHFDLLTPYGAMGLMAPGHYQSQCEVIITKVLRHSSENIIKRSEDTNQ